MYRGSESLACLLGAASTLGRSGASGLGEVFRE